MTNPDQLLALLFPFGGGYLYALFQSLPEEEKEIIPATVETLVRMSLCKVVLCSQCTSPPKQNTEYQTYEFCQCQQLPSEVSAKFLSRLKVLATTCNFTEVDSEIKSQV